MKYFVTSPIPIKRLITHLAHEYCIPWSYVVLHTCYQQDRSRGGELTHLILWKPNHFDLIKPDCSFNFRPFQVNYLFQVAQEHSCLRYVRHLMLYQNFGEKLNWIILLWTIFPIVAEIIIATKKDMDYDVGCANNFWKNVLHPRHSVIDLRQHRKIDKLLKDMTWRSYARNVNFFSSSLCDKVHLRNERCSAHWDTWNRGGNNLPNLELSFAVGSSLFCFSY